MCASGDLLSSFATGVGKSGPDEHPGPLVRRSEIGSSKHLPLRVIPAAGQTGQDLIEQGSSVKAKESCDVFHEDVSGS